MRQDLVDRDIFPARDFTISYKVGLKSDLDEITGKILWIAAPKLPTNVVSNGGGRILTYMDGNLSLKNSLLEAISSELKRSPVRHT
jgi:hypothetical protein